MTGFSNESGGVSITIGVHGISCIASITRISKFLSDNGVITRDVSGEIAQHYTYEFLAKATGKSPAELGQNQ